ncbi:MAG: type II toxin-antitoxin system HicA family toxin [Alphaproteobacteria bacterium]|nr:type II toxin-antitoxin system HicA family toxin [Alphaproteobacteria bacterium]
MRANPGVDWKIEDMIAIAERLGIASRRQGGSHVAFRAASGNYAVVPARRPIKAVDVRQFVAMIDGSGKSDDS